MRAGCESADMAAHHHSKAAGLEHQLERSVYSDDANAIEALEERIAEKEAQRDHMKARNAAYRKGVDAFAAFEGCTVEQATQRRATIEAGYSWCRQPHPSYELTNLGASIRTDKERVTEITRRAEKQAAAEAAPGGVLIKTTDPAPFSGTVYAVVTFAEKPDRSVLEALKAAGYHWGGGSWSGDHAKLPACVVELAGVPKTIATACAEGRHLHCNILYKCDACACDCHPDAPTVRA
jgi:hypothetical protein